MQTLLMLGARNLQVLAIRRARAMGLRVVVIEPDPGAPGFDAADEGHVADLADWSRCLAVARSCRPDGVMTFGADYPVATVARLCATLGLPGLSPAAALASTDKLVMRRRLAAAGVPVPRWRVATDLDGLLRGWRELDGPVIVKPSRSSGGRGVSLLDTGVSPAAGRRALEHALPHVRGGTLLVEQFVDGPEYSLEAITRAGRTGIVACTEKRTSGAPHFVETGHSQPASLGELERDALVQTASRAVTALGIDEAASHGELRLGPDGPVVIEVGARCGGGFISSHLIPLSTGVDMIGAAVAVALGRDVDVEPSLQRGSAVGFVTAPAGRVTRVGRVDEAAKLEGVVEVAVRVGPGDPVPPLTDATARIGHVITDGPTAAEAMARCEAALEFITIRTEPFVAVEAPA